MALNLESDIWFIDFNNTKPSGEIFAGGDYLEWVGLSHQMEIGFRTLQTNRHLSYLHTIIEGKVLPIR